MDFTSLNEVVGDIYGKEGFIDGEEFHTSAIQIERQFATHVIGGSGTVYWLGAEATRRRRQPKSRIHMLRVWGRLSVPAEVHVSARPNGARLIERVVLDASRSKVACRLYDHGAEKGKRAGGLGREICQASRSPAGEGAVCVSVSGRDRARFIHLEEDKGRSARCDPICGPRGSRACLEDRSAACWQHGQPHVALIRGTRTVLRAFNHGLCA